MKKFRVVHFAALLFSLAVFAYPHAVFAIPVFANGQGGISCDVCHSSVPQLNSTGRYILATNFARVLDAHAQMQQNKELPVALEVTFNASSPSDPTLPAPVEAGVVDLLSAGFLGPKVTYYASVPIVEDGLAAAGVDQVWAAYNGLSHGNGSLQVGLFPTPFFAPWTSQSLSLSGYGFAALPVGDNIAGVGDNRWGASYTQIGSKGLIANVAFLTNSGPLEQAFNGDPTWGGEGESWVGSLQYMKPISRLSGGLAFMQGTFRPLPTTNGNDEYSRAGALLSYDGPHYSLIASELLGSDKNPNDDGGLTPSGSNGASLEGLYNPRTWLHFDLRYDKTNDGLGNLANAYIQDVAIDLQPNIVLTVENVSTVGIKPVVNYQLLWAGPWWKAH